MLLYSGNSAIVDCYYLHAKKENYEKAAKQSKLYQQEYKISSIWKIFTPRTLI